MIIGGYDLQIQKGKTLTVIKIESKFRTSMFGIHITHSGKCFFLKKKDKQGKHHKPTVTISQV